MLKELAEVLSFRGRTDGGPFLEAIIEETPECIKIVGPDGSLLRMNGAGLRMIEAGSWVTVDGASTPSLIAEEDRDTWLANHGRICAGEKLSWQFDIVGLKGTRRHMETHAVPIQLEDGRTGQLAITRDVGERRQTELALQSANEQLDQLVKEQTKELERAASKLGETERNFRLLVKSVVDYAIYMLDIEGNVASWNEGAERAKGYSAGEIIGKHFSNFYTEEDRAAGLPELGLVTARTEGRWENEGWRVRKDGTRFWASVVIDAIREDGEVIGFAKVTRDITEKKAADERLRQAERLKAVGVFTGGAAHDFNNLLTAVLGSLELLRKRLPGDPRSLALLDNAVQGAKRGAALTQRMLAFARRQELKSESIDIGTMLAGMSDLLVQSVGPTVEVEMQISRDLPRVTTDQGQLENALLNLVVNARDAMPNGGKVSIAAKFLHGQAAVALDLTPGDYVCITVKDTGEGMDRETLGRVREPFFTTKGVGKGTGLGLSMVDGLVAQSGGRMRIESDPGKGTSVELCLPADEASKPDVAAPDAAVDAPASPIRKLRIMAVDDDALVLMNSVAMLEDLGHDVVEAASGSQALQVLELGEAIDLIITDQAMPGMTGVQLAEAVRERHPAMPIVLATGYAELPPGADTKMVRLAKPFTLGQLFQAVVQAIPPAPASP
ncbi:hybrid sensor histidine kinase/response regulator [Pararhizobium arenae]|uniref:hybrid sensor histidine kinase/response regulator n=1 Tax=Pararhizobium arenae TaxID=1856850 RepID=UPI00094ADD45|nr:PAS domain-containing sensor histidine kinase [Pararhizobium arenae]